MIEKITEIISKNAKNVDIIVLYGSYARGAETKESDIEFYAVVDSKDKITINFNFLIKEIPIDLWTQEWSVLERMSNYDGYWSVPAGSLAYGKIIYSKDEESSLRFLNLQKKLNIRVHQEKLLLQANKQFHELIGNIGRIQLAKLHEDLMEARTAIWGLIIGIKYILASVNHCFYANNWGKNLEEAYTFTSKPEDFKELINKLINTNNFDTIEKISLELYENTRKWMISLNKGVKVKEIKYEMLDGETGPLEYNAKLRKACIKGDMPSASYAIEDLQPLIARDLIKYKRLWDQSFQFKIYKEYNWLYDEFGFPDFNEIYFSKGCDELLIETESMKTKVHEFYEKHSLLIPKFTKVEEVEELIKEKFEIFKK